MKRTYYESENGVITIKPEMSVNEEGNEELAFIRIFAGSNKINVNRELIGELGELLHDIYEDFIQ